MSGRSELPEPRMRQVRRRVTDGAWPDERAFRFHSIVAPRAFEEVLDQLCFAIRSGVYSEGEALPNIDQLAAAMDVSRPTVSEAVKLLTSSGVLRTMRGNGGGIVVLSNDVPLELLSAQSSAWQRAARRELVEARRPIETQIAVLAGARATEDDFGRLEECLTKMARAHREDDLISYINADHRFHYVLGRAARNSVLAGLQHQVLAELTLMIDSWAGEFEQAEEVIALHATLIKAMRRRGMRQVIRAMEALIELVLEEEAVPSRPSEGSQREPEVHGIRR